MRSHSTSAGQAPKFLITTLIILLPLGPYQLESLMSRRKNFKYFPPDFPGMPLLWPLETAIRTGRVDYIAFRLAAGLNPNHRSPKSGSLVALAAKWGKLDAMNLFLVAGASPDAATAPFGHTALCYAAQLGRTDMAQSLFDHGVNMHALSVNHLTPATAAVKSGQADMLRWLFEHGAMVDAPDKRGRTPLMLAAESGQVGCLRVCLAFGADINARGPGNAFTPAMIAFVSEKNEALLALCEHGLDFSIRNERGQTLDKMAADFTHIDASIYKGWRIAFNEKNILMQSTSAPSLTTLSVPKTTRI